MRWKADTIITTVLVVCAVVTTASVVRREFIASRQPAATNEQKPTLVSDWRSHLDKGVRMGTADAPVQLLEFADFECPFCRSYHQTLKDLRQRYPRQVALSFVHFPLPMHRFAEPAARVAECAADQGRFESMYDLLFEQQDKLGLKPWSDFANEAGVPDAAAFEACVQRTDSIPRVVAGKLLGTKLGIPGTPTVVINGWWLGRPPTADELDKMVKATLAGKSPISVL